MKLNPSLKDIPTSKNDKEYWKYINSCLKKKSYSFSYEAVKAAMQLGNDKHIKTQIYFCNYCGKYHVTSHCRETTSGANHNFQVTDRNGSIIRKAKKLLISKRQKIRE
jgi:hypothetical protein